MTLKISMRGLAVCEDCLGKLSERMQGEFSEVVSEDEITAQRDTYFCDGCAGMEIEPTGAGREPRDGG